MKRLGEDKSTVPAQKEQSKKPNNKKKQKTKQNSEPEGMKCLAAVIPRDVAMQEKLKLLRGSFFGKPMVHVEVASERDVMIPCYFLTFHLTVLRRTAVKNLDKNLDINIIFDANEKHPFQYDETEEGKLPLKNSFGDKIEREPIKEKASEQEMISLCEDFIQRKVARRFYGREGKITLLRKTLFYRPAVEMETVFKNGRGATRYAYLDGFGIQSEHVLGLKYRVENKF